jgi:hypothetical protein
MLFDRREGRRAVKTLPDKKRFSGHMPVILVGSFTLHLTPTNSRCQGGSAGFGPRRFARSPVAANWLDRSFWSVALSCLVKHIRGSVL